jgi:hypothetical protein
MPVLSKLSANGNYTIAGTFDEATFNSTSSYRKNIIINSQNFGAAEWRHYDSSSAVVAAPNIAAPDGSYGQVYKLYETSVSGWHAFGQNLNSKYNIGTVSCYVKAAENWICGFDLNSFGTNSQFNLKTGTVQDASGWLNPTITFVGDGWYRISAYIFSGTFPNYQSYGGINVALSQNGTTTYLGVPGNGIYIWGFQFELGISGPSIYEPTGPNGIPVANFANKLDTLGNFYTAGDINEVTYNKTNPVFKNLLSNTESFSSPWGPNLGIVVPNAILAPDGKSYAIKLVERIDGSTPTSNQRILIKMAVDAQTVYTFSVYLKSGGRDYARIYFEDTTTLPDGGGRVGALLNLASGTITSTYLTGSNTLLGSNLQKFDNGWFRFSWTVKTFLSSPASGSAYMILGMGYAPTSFAYIGDGVSGMYFWGAQMEKGSQVTTYQGVGAPGVIVDSNTTTKLESSGNHYLAGSTTSYDEVTGIPPITDSIVLYLDPNIPESYPGTGTTWFDLSGNKNNGTLIAPSAINTNYSTKGIKFVFGSFTQFAASSKLNFSGLLPYTLESWIYPHTVTPVLTYPSIFNKNNQTPVRNGFVFLITGADASNQLLYSERWGNGVTLLNVSETISNTSFINKWHHCVIVFDGSVLRLYRNGVLTGTSSTSVVGIPSLGDNQNLQIGNQNLTLGRTVIYNRALSATEIQATYNATKLGYAY